MKPIFTQAEWKNCSANWEKFWNGDLKRPLVLMHLNDGSSKENSQYKRYFPQYGKDLTDFDVSQIESEQIGTVKHLGDAFPYRFTNFGPGSMATYFGSELGFDDSTVWYKSLNKELPEIDLTMDTSNFWYNRIKSIQENLISSFKGEAVVTYSDMGGNLDILASLRGSEKLLYDLYDCPDIVEKKVNEITALWLKCYKEESDRIRKSGRGFCPWAPVYSHTKTTYMLQCDFSYMISPDMFERFVLPDISECCNHIDIPFFHLDGKGELPHLDHLLSLPKLKGIQWIPGAGQAEASEWIEVLEKIRSAEKLVQIYNSLEGSLKLKREMSLEGFIIDVQLPENFTKKEAQEAYMELCN
jgi:5-methyltetrahydrofolate--homocysteine methyltransferase